jgi:hypothetical protein
MQGRLTREGRGRDHANESGAEFPDFHFASLVDKTKRRPVAAPSASRQRCLRTRTQGGSTDASIQTAKVAKRPPKSGLVSLDVAIHHSEGLASGTLGAPSSTDAFVS